MKTRVVLCINILLGILAITGCKKDFEFDKIKQQTWTPDIAVPLVNDEITFTDVLNRTGNSKDFYIDDSGDISILYYFRNNAFQLTPNDLLSVPPFTFAFDHKVTLLEQQVISTQDLELPPIDYTYDMTQSYPDVRIDKLLVKEGNVVLNINSTFSNNGHLLIRFINAAKNGVPFSYITGPIVAGNKTETIDLGDVQFDLASGKTTVTVEVSGQFLKSNSPVVDDKIHADFSLQVTKIGYFEGYLGHRTFTPDEASVLVTAFNNTYEQGNLYFIDPKASITIVNSYGIPLKITVTEMKGKNMNSGQTVDITDKLGQNSVISVPSPDINATEPVSKSIDYTNANTSNGMEQLFSIKPDNVIYKVTTEINPSKRGINFFRDTSSIYANLQVKLPLFGHFDHLTVQDTFDFPLNGQHGIQSANFHANFVNGFPMSARIQLYFTDQYYHPIDSITDGSRIMVSEAPVDPATHLPYPGQFGKKDTTFFFDQNRLSKVVNARYILVRAVMNSNNEGQTNVKIKATQALKVRFTAEAKMSVGVKP